MSQSATDLAEQMAQDVENENWDVETKVQGQEVRFDCRDLSASSPVPKYLHAYAETTCEDSEAKFSFRWESVDEDVFPENEQILVIRYEVA